MTNFAASHSDQLMFLLFCIVAVLGADYLTGTGFWSYRTATTQPTTKGLTMSNFPAFSDADRFDVFPADLDEGAAAELLAITDHVTVELFTGDELEALGFELSDDELDGWGDEDVDPVSDELTEWLESVYCDPFERDDAEL